MTNPPADVFRILMVDDDEDHLELLAMALRGQFPRATIDTVRCCEEALKKNPDDYQLALVDVNLPDGTGITVLRHIRTHGDLPVIMVTGERFAEPAIEGIRAGADDYLVKHADYLRVLPVVVHKTLAMQEIKRQNRRLQGELQSRNLELETLNEQLRQVAARDALTGLYNRRHFTERFLQLFAEAQRYQSDLTCVMIDVDGFKGVNDRMGHPAGDRLLCLVGESLRDVLRASDVAARYGGDEFVILLPRTHREEAQQFAKRLRSAFRDLLLRRMPEASSVTLSIGLASRESQQTADVEALLKAADEALYQAKAAGRDCIVAPA